jgi:hypothetical protein
MKTYHITRIAMPALALIAWLLVPQTAHCFYNASTGRWLSRDPLDELSFRDSYAATLSPRSRRALQTRHPSATEYGFVNNQPSNLVDLSGLTTWRGKCSFISAGEFIGGIVIDCDLVSFCEVGDDNHREYAHVVGFILDLTVGIPIEITVSDNTFKTSGKTGYKAFRGSAAIAQIGWATGPIGFALYKIKLGDGVSEGVGSDQLGLSLGESAGVGFSISKGTKQWCKDL